MCESFELGLDAVMTMSPVAGVPAWAGTGGAPNSNVYAQLVQYLTCPV